MAYVIKEDELMHYGTPRHSGRYPWGSGDDPQQRNTGFLGYVNELRSQGLSELEIATGLGMTTSELRNKKSLAKAEQRAYNTAEALRLKDKGMSNVEIGKRMNLNESSVRALLDPALQERSEITATVSNMLKDTVSEKGYIDVGAGVEQHIGISRTKLNTSLAALQEEGYEIMYVQVEQLGTGKMTSIKVLAPPGTEYADLARNKDQIRTITDFSEDGGRTMLGLMPVKSIDSSRLAIKYAEDGGEDKDGVIELRRGVDDISLGNAQYAQVRIGVDGSHYLKGMAIYSDNLPDGVDLMFNTNKSNSVAKMDVLKSMKKTESGDIDDDNPFGASIKKDEELRLAQRYYTDKNGKKQLSSINVVSEEGDWTEWSKTISSQMLSKQSPSLAKKQLDISLAIKKDEFDEINSLTNPAVKKRLLDAYADDCDASASHLQAAGLPRQGWHAILPITEMKDTEIYAPNYRNGEKVVLIRYPHGGTFEIPELTVNNKNVAANKIIKNAPDAVGINPKVAKQLSGADFDGDTVLVIPNPKNIGIKTSSPLKGLQDFEPKTSYKGYEGMVKMTSKGTQQQMGNISNLITDMTIKGANTDEIARAVRHSMVVIDAEKHGLNYKQSAIDNGIADLKKKYQGATNAGAATLISRAESEKRVASTRKEVIDPSTGKKTYINPGESYTTKSGKTYVVKEDTYVDKKGKTITKTVKSTKMQEVDDAKKLSSGTMIEGVYASHANKLKTLANTARKESASTKTIPYSPSAKVTFKTQVDSLMSKLNVALRNAPLERQAQLLANKVVSTKKNSNPNMDAPTLKKIKGQALVEARTRTGAKKQQIVISDKEWDAIQAGAVSNNTLTKILNNADLDSIKQLATPRSTSSMSPAKIARANSMLSAGFTQAEVADALGVSTTTIAKAID